MMEEQNGIRDCNARELEARPRAAGPPGAGTWADLMRRAFDLDVLATVQDPIAVQAILAHRARAAGAEPPGPAPPPAPAT